MAYKPFTLYKRPTTKKGNFAYYVQFRDPDTGKRLSGISSGQQTKAAAETWAVERIKKGLISSKGNARFAIFAEDWWIWDRCPYIKKKIARGSMLSQSYCDDNRRILEK